MSAKAQKYIDGLTANGEISFTLGDLCEALAITPNAALAALYRLRDQHKIASPARGYYLVLTPEFRNKGCLPADFFIDDLMRYLESDYYVYLLSAALYYGTAHQQPQLFQVMLPDRKRNIECASVTIEFIKNSHSNRVPIRSVKTRTGYIKVSTPEATAVDMIKYMRHCGGIGRVVTVLDELAEMIDARTLIELTEICEERAWIHRLGFILDKLGKIELAESLYCQLRKNHELAIPLVPYQTMKGAVRDKKWKIAINAVFESDLDDTD